jgi:multidrug efflux pump subunit AcrB
MLWTILALLLVAVGLFVSGAIPLKMLPYDNKSELQVVLDLPEGATLEATDAAVRDVERYLATVPEATNFEAYVGVASPIDFNGLVRRYGYRRAPNLADVRINLVSKDAACSRAMRSGCDCVAISKRSLHATARNSRSWRCRQAHPSSRPSWRR